jgi:hypothetical protein
VRIDVADFLDAVSFRIDVFEYRMKPCITIEFLDLIVGDDGFEGIFHDGVLGSNSLHVSTSARDNRRIADILPHNEKIFALILNAA